MPFQRTTGGYTQYSQQKIPFKEINAIPESLLMHIIDFLKCSDLKTVPIKVLERQIECLINMFSIQVLTSPYYAFVYRAQITNSNAFTRLIYPPKESVITLGRCNDIHESMLYCSNCFVTSILEIKPKLNDIVTVLVIHLDNTDYSNNYLPLVTLSRDNLNEELVPTLIKPSDSRLRTKLEVIERFFSDILCKDVPVGNEFEYKLSIALTKAMLTRHKNQPVGMAFPSQASKHYGINFAIAKSWIDNLTKPKYMAFRVKIINKLGNFNSIGLVTEVARKLDSYNNFIFESVSHLNHSIELNEDFYKKYDYAFSIQRSELKKDSFFRKFYPPPLLNPPFNLLPAENYKEIDISGYEHEH